MSNAKTAAAICKKEWNAKASRSARKTINPIRRIVDRCKLLPNPGKALITLSIGDPTYYGNMLPPIEASEAVNEAFAKPTSHGYLPSCGMEEAREAIAKLWSRNGHVLDTKDIILTSGCSHALEMCINGVADPGDNILIPQPGFSVYITLCESLHIEPRYYKLKPEQNWELDLDDLETAINSKTKAVLVNNPSNPCGAVYSAEHLKQIIDICEKHRLIIIADEIYADMVFPGNEFHFMGVLSQKVPILSCGGLAKRYICPGWRIGWIAMHDRMNILKESIQPGLLDLSSRILGPNSVMQAALPKIVANTPQKYFDNIISQIQNNAEISYKVLSTAPGLKPIMPQGAMYMLDASESTVDASDQSREVGLDPTAYDDVENDTVFFTKLFNEQSVSCLPASVSEHMSITIFNYYLKCILGREKVFGMPNYFRLVLTTPYDKTQEACERIVEFCHEHKQITNPDQLRASKDITRWEVRAEGLAQSEESILPFYTNSKRYVAVEFRIQLSLEYNSL
ncbi:unnamed protein product [Rotaria socialis]